MVTTKSGEGLLNCGTHVIDACRYLMGDPGTEWVMGAVERKTDRYERDVPVEDCCMCLIQFKGGAQAVRRPLRPYFLDADEIGLPRHHRQGAQGVGQAAGNALNLVVMPKRWE